MTHYPDLFGALLAPFEPDEVRTRPQAGRQIQYITARTAMNRLDTVLGPENWWDDYVPGENSVVCRLSIRLPDGSIVTKCDAGGYAGMQDQGDDEKSAFSDAFKRAAIKFGVGRYLYRDGVPRLRREPGDDDDEPGPIPQSGPGPQRPRDHGSAGESGDQEQIPRTGRALFAWVKDQESRHQVNLLRYLNNWAKLQEFPGRMVDWYDHQVSLAYAEAIRKLATLPEHSTDSQDPTQN